MAGRRPCPPRPNKLCNFEKKYIAFDGTSYTAAGEGSDEEDPLDHDAAMLALMDREATAKDFGVKIGKSTDTARRRLVEAGLARAGEGAHGVKIYALTADTSSADALVCCRFADSRDFQRNGFPSREDLRENPHPGIAATSDPPRGR